MKRFSVFDMVLLTMFGALMFISDIILEFLPNIHGVAMLICVVTLVYRIRALISIFVYVMLNAVTALGSFYTLWWLPYLYIFPILWLLVMLIPKKASIKVKIILSAVFAGLHGMAFGTLYVPFQALMFGLNFESAVTWIIAGLPWDAVHMAGNLAMSTLIYPLYKLLLKLESRRIK